MHYCLDKLNSKGAEKAACRYIIARKQELNVHAGKLNLFRTINDINLGLTAIFENRKGTITINKIGVNDLDQAIENVIEMAESSQPDKANDIAGFQEAKQFSKGPTNPDLDLMYTRLDNFVQQVREKYPRIILEEVILSFNTYESYFMNSNKVDFQIRKSAYDFSPMFTAKEGLKTSSFNYTDFSTLNLDKEFLEYGTIDLLLKQASEQISTSRISGKFTGDIIVTPDCLPEFIRGLTSYLGDRALISDTSIYKDKLNRKIASENFTLQAQPRSDLLASGYFLTSDGFEAQNLTIIDKGILSSFLLSLYGANKTGKDRAQNQGGCYVINPGEEQIENIIKKVKRGLLLCRFSGGNPNDKGDFSGVAKNSYYIEDGKIKYPISETMITGNIADMFINIKDISRERINFGDKIIPWIRFGEISISG